MSGKTTVEMDVLFGDKLEPRKNKNYFSSQNIIPMEDSKIADTSNHIVDQKSD